MSQTSNWQNIIWREWRNTEDKEYARQLFDLVADEPVGWGTTLSIIILGVCYGAVTGLISGLFFAGMSYVILQDAPILVLVVFAVFILAGSILGGLGGYLGRILLGRHLSWRVWLEWLVPITSSEDLKKMIDYPHPGLILFVLPIWGVVFLFRLMINFIVLITFVVIDWISVRLTRQVADRIVARDRLHKIFSTLSSQNDIYDFRSWWFWWRKRPHMLELEIALQEACQSKSSAHKIWSAPLARLERKKQSPGSPDVLILNLQSQQWIDRFIARHILVMLGGETIRKLLPIVRDKTNSTELHRTTFWLLENIGWETTSELANRASISLCPQCLVYYGVHQVRFLVPSTLIYYGCRVCHQSRKFLSCPEGIIAVLDATSTETQNQQNGLLRVNWLARRTLFDFDRVEIIQASDEEVERFAVQIGNDTDVVRKPRYKEMSCLVAPGCHLSENTWRILRSLFGQVESLTIGEI